MTQTQTNNLIQRFLNLRWYKMCALILCISVLLGVGTIAVENGVITPSQTQGIVTSLTDQITGLQNNVTTLQNQLNQPVGSTLSATRESYSFQVSFATNGGVPDRTLCLQSGVNGSLVSLGSSSTDYTSIAVKAVNAASFVGGSVYFAEGNYTTAAGVSMVLPTIPANVSVTMDIGAYGFVQGTVLGTFIDNHNQVYFLAGQHNMQPYSFMVYPGTFPNGTVSYNVKNGTDNQVLTSWTSTNYSYVFNTASAAMTSGLLLQKTGIYYAYNNLTFNAGTNKVFAGEGQGTIIYGMTAGMSMLTVGSAGTLNWYPEVRDLALTGIAENVKGLTIIDATIPRVRDVTFGRLVTALTISGSYGPSITGCYFALVGNDTLKTPAIKVTSSVFMGSSTTVYFGNNVFEDNTYYQAINIDGATGVTIGDGNRICVEGSGGNSAVIYDTSPAGFLTITGSAVSATAHLGSSLVYTSSANLIFSTTNTHYTDGNTQLNLTALGTTSIVGNFFERTFIDATNIANFSISVTGAPAIITSNFIGLMGYSTQGIILYNQFDNVNNNIISGGSNSGGTAILCSGQYNKVDSNTIRLIDVGMNFTASSVDCDSQLNTFVTVGTHVVDNGTINTINNIIY